MKKPKSAAKLAAEASDKLDQLASAEERAIGDACTHYEAICYNIRKRFSEKEDAIWIALPAPAAARLRGMRSGAAEVFEPEATADEPTHLREVMP